MIDSNNNTAEQQAVAVSKDECWSSDEENFHAGSLAEFLTSHDHLVSGMNIWRGLVERPNNTHLIDANDIIDQLADRAHDIAGEHADDYPDVSEEARIELDQLLSDWIDKHAPPAFFTVSSVTRYTLADTDFVNTEDAQ